jgi:hypothetical protein
MRFLVGYGLVEMSSLLPRTFMRETYSFSSAHPRRPENRDWQLQEAMTQILESMALGLAIRKYNL